MTIERYRRVHGLHPRTILVITYGGIGDILLTTPLIESLKSGFPDARIDVFVQDGRQGMLEGNPSVDTVYTAGRRHGPLSYIDFIARFGARYDLAVSPRISDRQTLFARIAGRAAIGMVPRERLGNLWKRLVLSGWAVGTQAHNVESILRLAEVVGVEKTRRVAIPHDPESPGRLDLLLPFAWRSEAFAVLQLYPRSTYKRWTLEGWAELASSLVARGLRVVVVGGPSDQEAEYVDDLCCRVPGVISIAGETSFADLAELLRECRVYVGLDTATSHLAAAAKAPTVALYGPPESRRYFPYHEALSTKGVEVLGPRVERSGTVWVTCGSCACVGFPTRCERAPNEAADCMKSIEPEPVIQLVDRIVGRSGIAMAPTHKDGPAVSADAS